MKVIEQLYQEETAAYDVRRAELLLAHAGKFALIRGIEFLGVFDTFSSAYGAGLKAWGNVPMFIRKIESQEHLDEFPSISN